jgi:uncharacterized protein (TIGR02646 family)
MIGAFKSSPEGTFVRWCLRQTSSGQFNYKALSGQDKIRVREKLWKEQNGMCVYCGRRVEANGRDSKTGQPTVHIEHFRPQSRYRALELCHANLFLSCGPSGIQGETCGNKKDDWFDEALTVYPNHTDVLDRFKCNLNGKLVPKSSTDSAANEMINKLNLNHDELVAGRKHILDKIDRLELQPSEIVDQNNLSLVDYAHVAAKYIGFQIKPIP